MSETFLFAGARTRLLSTGEQTGGGFCLLEMIQPADARTPPHCHARDEETLYMLEGALHAMREGSARRLVPGQWTTLPRYEPHCLANCGVEDARYLLLGTPAGFDAFVREAGDPAPDPRTRPSPPSPAGIERMAAVAPRHGITLLNPAKWAIDGADTQLNWPAAPEVIRAMGPTIEILAEFGPADTDVCLIRGVMPPGVSIPLHTHPHPEAFYIVSGKIDVFQAAGRPGAWTRVGPGDWVPIATDVRHALRNAGDVAATAVIITTMGVGRFFRDLGRLSATLPSGPPKSAPPPEAMAQFADLVRRHGFWRGSAEENAAIGWRDS